MRISDWSSDVCSSDLCRLAAAFPPDGTSPVRPSAAAPSSPRRRGVRWQTRSGLADPARCAASQPPGGRGRFRSEEHTSELQSLMRTSYAVFCLQKKIHNANDIEHVTY